MSGRVLGYALLAGAGVLALLMFAWLAVAGVNAGGFVLGLILLVILAGPLAIAGVVVLSRQPAEAAAQAAFASKQRIIDADRLFRRELAPELRQLARQASLPAAQLQEMAEDLERSTYDRPEWYATLQLGDADAATLKRYDDLVWDRVRLLRERAMADAPSNELQQDVRELEVALDQRRDLLLRGRRAPEVAPSTMLRAGSPARGADALRDLALGDALSHDGTDYVVEGVANYFAEGQSWKLVHLVATANAPARWLYVGPGAFEVALLDEAPAPPADLPRVTSGTATVDVTSQAGSARAVLVSVTRFADAHSIAVAEDWPDGAHHVYVGPPLSPTDLEVWPAQLRTP
jgi:hypothetical protein